MKINATLKKLIYPCYRVVRVTQGRLNTRRLLNNNATDIYLEIGAGDKKGEDGWTTVDMTRKCDIYWNLKNGIPFPSNSVKRIYSSHFLEHLPFTDGQSFLQESLRVLSPGGEFSICVPNARLYIDAYMAGTLPFEEKQLYIPAINRTTPIDYINYMAYMDGNHYYMFDKENLLCRLEQAGFKDVMSREFDPELDNKARDFESLYAIATK